MRAGPLSSPRVIDLLNARFVPVFAVNEDYRKGGSAPDEEKALYDRVYREALAKGDVKAAQTQYRETVSTLDKSVQKGVFHKNTVSRYKSRLNARLKALATAKA